MRRAGAARRAELEFSARAHTVCAIGMAIGAPLAWLMVRDIGLVLLMTIAAVWLARDAAKDRCAANSIATWKD